MCNLQNRQTASLQWMRNGAFSSLLKTYNSFVFYCSELLTNQGCISQKSVLQKHRPDPLSQWVELKNRIRQICDWIIQIGYELDQSIHWIVQIQRNDYFIHILAEIRSDVYLIISYMVSKLSEELKRICTLNYIFIVILEIYSPSPHSFLFNKIVLHRRK